MHGTHVRSGSGWDFGGVSRGCLVLVDVLARCRSRGAHRPQHRRPPRPKEPDHERYGQPDHVIQRYLPALEESLAAVADR